MKTIVICYVSMLFICILVGIIVALMCKYSLWWGFLFVFPVSWFWIPLSDLRLKIPIYSDFSQVLLMISFALIVVIVVPSMLLIKFESYWSIVCAVSSILSAIVTVWLFYFVPQNPDSIKRWRIMRENGLVIVNLKKSRWFFRRLFSISGYENLK